MRTKLYCDCNMFTWTIAPNQAEGNDTEVLKEMNKC